MVIHYSNIICSNGLVILAFPFKNNATVLFQIMHYYIKPELMASDVCSLRL